MSKVLFLWITPLLRTVSERMVPPRHATTAPHLTATRHATRQGKQRPLEFDDLQELETMDQSAFNGRLVRRAWAEELRATGHANNEDGVTPVTQPGILRTLLVILI